jgi:hypothetical protein
LLSSLLIISYSFQPFSSTPAEETIQEIVNQLGVISFQPIITEVVGGPSAVQDEFVEVCNIGESSGDLKHYFLANSNADAQGNSLVAWGLQDNERARDFFDPELFNTQSTILAAKQCALILSPAYRDTIYQPKIPHGVLILTVGQGEFLGAERYGIVTQSPHPASIILYTGNRAEIEVIASSYGFGAYNLEISTVSDFSTGIRRLQDSGALFPFHFRVGDYGVTRVNCSSNIDSAENWDIYQDYTNATPGFCR